ncbi:HD-GYP domain-containing protein [Desulfovirgula thermocuniculi]|uniref:HD-GYP domain-containing protein n=1 Tax=Desulfovirgula thermocuniculi TaxID=348842 RepID=UPI001B7F997B|nr:HD domain-containing phosphohydrolase [Desulfovirgula thermocuniculi]
MARLALESMPGPVVITDLAGRIVYLNRAGEAAMGVRREEVLHRPLVEAFYKGEKFDAKGRYRSPVLETLETGKEFPGGILEIRAFPHALPKLYLVHTFFVREESGEVAGVCGIYNDLMQSRELTRKAVLNRLVTISQQFETIYAFAEAIGARDPYTMGHCEKVAEYARLIAEAMGLGEKEISLAYICGIVHDVGKIGVPESILNKPGSLTKEEFAYITLHPEKGASILSHISWLEDVVPVVLAHHERYDGGGYPMGLKGEEIPLLSRILAVADAFDAMTSDRSYRKALPLPVAVQELKRHAGKQFDPQVVEAFLEIIGHLV